jgi:hypothetical protein
MKHVDNRGLSNSSGDQGDARYRFGEGHRTHEWTTACVEKMCLVGLVRDEGVVS